MSINVAHLLARAARIHPQRPALARGTRLLANYAELGARVARIAGGLAAQLQPNDRVALIVTEPLTTNETWLPFTPGELKLFVDGQPVG